MIRATESACRCPSGGAGTGHTGIPRILGACLALAALTAPAAAQTDLGRSQGFGDRPRMGVGYVANAPNMFQGVSAYVLLDVLGGLGLYVDGKRSISTPRDEPDFVDSVTVADIPGLPGSHSRQHEDSGWWSVNGALMRPITPELMLYMGAGYTNEDVYYRYRTNNEEVGTLGWYWVEDEEASGGGVNILGGAFLRMSRSVALQFGFETLPKGFTVGGSYSFSLGR